MKTWLLDTNHPILTDGTRCPYCRQPFYGGDLVGLSSSPDLSVPADPEEADRQRAGRPYTAVTVLVHAACEPA